MSQTGLVAFAFVGLWIAYLVPHRLRFRQQLLEARTEDRFSDELRVVRVAHASRPQPVGTGALRRPTRPARVAEETPRGVSRTYLHPPGRGWDGTMHRPHGAADRITADAARRAAAERARRAAHVARRRAAARRRALLTAVLLVASVGGWVAVGAASAGLVAGLLPTTALLATLVLGRRAVIAGQRADAEWAVRARELAVVPHRSTTGIVGRAAHPSDAQTEVMTRVGRTAPGRRGGERARAGVDAAERGSAGRAGGAAGSGGVGGVARTSARAADGSSTGVRGAAGAAGRGVQVAKGAEGAAGAEGAGGVAGRAPAGRGMAADGSVTAEGSAGRAVVGKDDRSSAPAPAIRHEATVTREASGAVATPTDPATTWAPVPVPRPTYTLKPEARRPEPAPLVLDGSAESSATAAGSSGSAAAGAAGAGGPATDGSGAAESGTGGTSSAGTATAEPPSTPLAEPSTATGGLPIGGSALDAVLARRRAAGA